MGLLYYASQALLARTVVLISKEPPDYREAELLIAVRNTPEGGAGNRTATHLFLQYRLPPQCIKEPFDRLSPTGLSCCEGRLTAGLGHSAQV